MITHIHFAFRSTTRKFTASDGKEYKWSFRTTPGQEWSVSALYLLPSIIWPSLTTQSCLHQCTSIDNVLVAHYDLKPPDVRTYGIVSGHNLTVYEPFAYLSPGVWNLVHGIA